MSSPSTSVTTWTIGAATVSRVPYFEVGLPADAIGLTDSEIRNVVERTTDARRWLDDEGQPLVGQAFWVVESAGSMIVIDPCSASDAFLRTGPAAIDHQGAALSAFSAAGFDPRAVDIVLLSHLDGIGMAALMTTDGGWEPAFPAAQILVSHAEYELIADNPDIPGAEIFGILDRDGAVSTVELPHRVTEHIELTASGGHSEGHFVISISSEGHQAIFLGHLAISPIDLLTPHGASRLHADAPGAADALSSLLHSAAASDATLFGSLWPAPAAVRVSSVDPILIEVAPG